MSRNTKLHITATLNVILALFIRFSTQYLHNNNRSDTYTYQSRSQWNIETNLIDLGDADDSDEDLLAFSEYFMFIKNHKGGRSYYTVTIPPLKIQTKSVF